MPDLPGGAGFSCLGAHSSPCTSLPAGLLSRHARVSPRASLPCSHEAPASSRPREHPSCGVAGFPGPRPAPMPEPSQGRQTQGLPLPLHRSRLGPASPVHSSCLPRQECPLLPRSTGTAPRPPGPFQWPGQIHRRNGSCRERRTRPISGGAQCPAGCGREGGEAALSPGLSRSADAAALGATSKVTSPDPCYRLPSPFTCPVFCCISP